ncbi:CPA1 family monovalent cation:H+ antiporter [Chelatococcus caeni]|uniref:CPA1 family monovalent cation:H+ antiporter n=1 Tax=Chelatococcus caeni TaxID=1348468 RepID=A0A840C0W9_9HYPH|nr:cation:proton antiporter [Chelatococcus caeni]MBB4018443.1 CPA1 family monovalent cation:H+ antiporter [Chelatococcus caeni]
MALPVILAVIGVLLLVISLAQPLAGALRMPFSVVLAAIGMLIGAAASFLLHTELTDAFNEPARAILDFPIGSTVFLYVFLPTLIFQTALTLDVRQMMPDWVPIFVLAVLAVVVATAVIGLALLPLAGQPLLVCLLLGAIVATTDPVAVVGIFRDIGAPARLGRLVEGESLLNDAAAITLFSVFLAILVAGETPGFGDAALSFLWTLCGGALVGHLAARAAAWLIGRMPEQRSAAVSISFALAYLVFIACEQLLGVSGVIAVVVAGMTLSLIGPSRASPDGWSYLTGIWDQIAFWASSLVFVLAAILVPRLLASLSLFDLFLILVVAAAALAARAVILFALLPLLSLLKLSPPVSIPYRVVILWGGLRGAVTLALALAVTENDIVPDDIQRFVAILATGFVLFTLLIQGTTMRWVISSLGLNLLSPRDAAMRGQVLAVALENVREAVARAAEAYRVASATALSEARRYAERIDEAASAGQGRELTDKERLSLGLLTLAGRERDIIIERMRARTVSAALLPSLLAQAETLLDRARAGGWSEYQRAAKQTLAFDWKFGFAQFLHRRLHASGPLERLLARRFEMLFVARTVLEELSPFIDSKIVPILGLRVGEVLHEIVERRQEAVAAGLDALRLQYPLYAESLERRLLRKIALRQEELEYIVLFEDGLIGPELYDNLRRSVDADRKEADRQRRLDLALNARELVGELPLFADLTGEQLTEVTKLLQPLFVIPGEQVIRRGAPGDAVYFVASGALEVSLPGRKVRLGRGDVVGEMALLHGRPRQSDVHAISYCFLLRLDVRAFQGFLAKHPGIRQSIEQVAAERAAANAEAVA